MTRRAPGYLSPQRPSSPKARRRTVAPWQCPVAVWVVWVAWIIEFAPTEMTKARNLFRAFFLSVGRISLCFLRVHFRENRAPVFLCAVTGFPSYNRGRGD